MTPISDFNGSVKSKAMEQRGFTLLELLMVLTIIGMASILIVPNLSSLESRTFSAQVRQANSLLNYARRLAVVNGQPSTASFIINPALEPEEPRPLSNSAGDWKSEGISVRYKDSTDTEVEIEERIDVVFYPEGGSTGGTFYFTMNEEVVEIEINPFTGRIETQFPDEI